MNKVCAQCRHFVSPEVGISYCKVRTEIAWYAEKSMTLKLPRNASDSAATCAVYDEVIPF